LVQRGVHTSVKDEAFLSELFHDIGQPVLWIYEAQAYQELIWKIKEEKTEAFEAEEEVLGIHHGEIGGKLAQHWNFPREIIEAIREHHHAQPQNPAALLVQLADLMVHNAWFSDGLWSMRSFKSVKSRAFDDVDPQILIAVAQELIRKDHEIQELVTLLRG
jgi:HD-like signal output (HDOD) protein